MKQVMKLTEAQGSSTMKPTGRGDAIQSLPANWQSLSRSCVRCAGLLVSEWIYDLQNSFTHKVQSLRCVQCGNRIDPVILENQLPAVGRISSYKAASASEDHLSIP